MLQVLTGLGATLGKGTTTSVDQVLDVLRIPVNMDLDLGCLITLSFVQKSILKMAGLFIYVIIDFVFSYSRKVVATNQGKALESQDDHNGGKDSNDTEEVDGDPDGKTSQHYYTKAARVYNSSISRINYIAFLVYPSLCQTAFLGFDCRWVEGSRFLSSDFSINCDSGPYTVFFVLNIFFVLGFVLGLPAGYAYLLITHRTAFLSEDTSDVTEGRFHFLVKDYRNDVFYYELFLVVRKMILIGFLSLVAKESIVQLYIGLLLALYFFVSLAWTKPYKSMSLNAFATFADMFVVSYCTMMMAHGCNSFLNDVYFNEGFFLTAYFYAKILVTLSVIGFVVYMRGHEIDAKDVQDLTEMMQH